MLYLLVILVLCWLSYYYDYKKNRKRKSFAYFSVLIIFIFIAGLRYRLGVDSVRYESDYMDMPTFLELFSIDLSSYREDIGYLIFNSIARSISDQFVVMQLLHASFVNTVMFRFFKQYTQNIFLAVLLYFTIYSLYFNFMCEVMRESCAVACFLWGWQYFQKCQWLKYYVWAIICTLFHVSGFVTLFLPILYLSKIRFLFVLDGRMVLILAAIVVIGNQVNIWLFDYIQSWMVLESLQNKAVSYADTDLAYSGLNYKGVIFKLAASTIFPIIAFLLAYRGQILSSQKEEKEYSCLQFILSICFMFNALTCAIPLFYRYNNYFLPFVVIVLCNCAFQTIYIRWKRYKMFFRVWLIIIFPYICLQDVSIFRPIDGTQLKEYMRYYPYASRIDLEKSAEREKVFQYYNAW